MQRNCKRKEKKKEKRYLVPVGWRCNTWQPWSPGWSRLYSSFVLPTGAVSPKSILVEGTGTKAGPLVPD